MLLSQTTKRQVSVVCRDNERRGMLQVEHGAGGQIPVGTERRHDSNTGIHWKNLSRILGDRNDGAAITDTPMVARRYVQYTEKFNLRPCPVDPVRRHNREIHRPINQRIDTDILSVSPFGAAFLVGSTTSIG